MALTQITTSGIANGAITSTLINPSVQLGGPTISQIQITDSSYNVLDDTAVSTSGGYIKITGTGFAAGAIVVIGSVNATSTGFVSSTVLNVQVPALTAGTYTVYVVNTNGGTAIGVNGLTYSGSPTWVTASTLSNGVSGTPISIQLSATGDTPMTYALAAGNTLPSGLTLTSGGLLSGTVTVGIETVYAFTVVATDVQLQDSPRAFTITITVGDPYFYLTTLLLPGNGTNNGTNNTFLDSSTNNFTVTRVGNPTQGAASPYSLTGWSNFFDGNGDSVSVPDNAALEFGSGDFTIECWANFSTSTNGTGYTLVAKCISAFTSTSAYAFVRHSGNKLRFIFSVDGGTGSYGYYDTTDNFIPIVGKWYHLAVTRSGTNFRLFIDGVNQTTTSNFVGGASSSSAIADVSTAVTIGGTSDGDYTNGYISNVRILKGTALYTATFTPPTAPLTAIANTSLLTCQSNRFIDNSTNNFTITRNGDVSVQSFSPFAPTASYTAGTVGGSAYLDGTGDYFTFPDNANLELGSSNFTIELWIKTTSSTQYDALFSRELGQSAGSWTMLINVASATAGDVTFWSYDYNSFTQYMITTTGVSIRDDAWHHIALVRNGSSWVIYVDGISRGSQTASITISDAAGGIWLGNNQANPGRDFPGYMADCRIVKGTAVYTSNFTPPTAPLTAITNTQLLLSFTNGQIIDATSKNVLETVGNAKISTDQSKWGGSSMYFDGTGDWLQIPYNEYYNIGSSNYTVEAWIKTTVTTGEIVSAFSSSSPFPGWLFGIGFNNNDGKLKFYNANGSSSESFTSTGTVNNNNWNHVAVTKSGTSLRFFINGTLDSTHTMTIVGTGSNQPILIGADNNPSKGRYYTGYINDLRVTKGYARYTTNFTPPTSAFPTL